MGILDNICIFSIQFKLCYTQRVRQRQFSLHPPQFCYFRCLLDKFVQCCRCHTGTGSMCVARSVGGCNLLRTCLFLAHLVLSTSDSVLGSSCPLCTHSLCSAGAQQSLPGTSCSCSPWSGPCSHSTLQHAELCHSAREERGSNQCPQRSENLQRFSSLQV